MSAREQSPADSPTSLTLFCDASYDPHSRAAGWGAWAKRDGWPMGRLMGSAFRRGMASAHEAELCGIANAVSLLEGMDAFDGVCQVMVQCDCMRALEMILGHVPRARASNHADGAGVGQARRIRPTDTEAMALKRLVDFVREYRVEVVVRHVRGHQNGDKRQWVNRQCDAIARKHMREARTAIGAREKTR